MSLRIILASAALLVAGGLVVAAEPRFKLTQAAPKPSTVCAAGYVPVCGSDKGGKQQAYDNECLAKAAGATRIYGGPCISDITF